MSEDDELWGTFAVDDHLRPRAFVAETVLFDRLIIPYPPPDDEEQYAEWVGAGWHPERLKETLAPLEDLAIAVPWDKQLRAQWQKEYSSLTPSRRASVQMKMARGAAFDASSIKSAPANGSSKFVTRMVLANNLNAQADDELFQKIKSRLAINPLAEIESIVGYGSYARFQEEVPIEETPEPNPMAGDAALLVTWEFLVPEDSDLTDAELLKRAAALSRNSEFQISRREFHDWRRKLIAKRVTVEAALAEMNRCLAIYNDIVDKRRLRSRALAALQVAAIAAPLADLAFPGAGMIGGVVFSAGAFLADKLVPVPQVGEREKIAALVHDSREVFGWDDGGASRRIERRGNF
jgi:hypothetical protein